MLHYSVYDNSTIQKIIIYVIFSVNMERIKGIIKLNYIFKETYEGNINNIISYNMF